MKGIRRISLTILLSLGISIMMLTPLSVAAQPATNLAPNPSFENGTTQPDGWTALPGNSGGSLVWDNTVAHSGSHSISIFGVTNDAWTAAWCTTDFIPVAVLDEPDFSAWVKMAGTKGKEYVFMQLIFYDANGNRKGGFGKNLPYFYGNWTQVEFLATDPNGWNSHLSLVESSTYLRLQFAVVDYNDGASALTVWFDDVFFEGPPATNEPPVVDAGPYQTANEGDTVNLAPATFTDADIDDIHTASINWGDTSPTEAGTVSESGGSGTVSGSHVYADNGSYEVTVCVSDDYGDETCDTLTVTVNNVTPVANAGEDKAGNEPSTFTFTGSHTDPGILDTHIYEWDYDYDGMTFDVDATGNGVSNTWLDDFDGTAALRVTDNDSGSGIATCSVKVNNVPPTITSLTLPETPVNISETVSLFGTFTDPGSLDTHTATIDWGEGVPESGTVTESGGNGEVTGSRTYSLPGVYTVTLNVTDDDGGSDTEVFRYVVIYNPDGGFVTGGGWIESPEGAYTPDTSLTGKANFGFVSKYKKGSSEPDGNTQFQFKAGDLNFHSENYQWLVIAGSKAMYKGTGTVNGEGNYGFMISAIDAKLTPSTDVDRFRIKIWNKDNGDSVIYDNQIETEEHEDPTTGIGGGNIVIHKSK